MLSAHGLHRTMTLGRKTTDILRGCDLELEGGGLTAIVGHSGSGKSSLLMCLSGLDQPTSGTVMLNGRDIYHQSEKQRAKMLRSEVGFVFQQYNLVPFLSVEENISLSFRLDHSLPPGEVIDNLIDSFDLSHRKNSPARLLSGGEQQRTALCRALARQPGILFADEPPGALDSQNTQLVFETLRRMADNGKMIVMVTHDIDAAALADTVVIMHDGRTVFTMGHSASREILAVMSNLKA